MGYVLELDAPSEELGIENLLVILELDAGQSIGDRCDDPIEW
jgi:hypothetical protein